MVNLHHLLRTKFYRPEYMSLGVNWFPETNNCNADGPKANDMKMISIYFGLFSE